MCVRVLIYVCILQKEKYNLVYVVVFPSIWFSSYFAFEMQSIVI